MIPVTVAGEQYKSIAEAHRALSPDDLPIITVRKRLKDGWPEFLAFVEPPVEAKVRRNYKLKRLLFKVK